jgi:hypothetical protein
MISLPCLIVVMRCAVGAKDDKVGNVPNLLISYLGPSVPLVNTKCTENTIALL